MKAVVNYMNTGVAPLHHLSVKPDISVTVIKGDQRHNFLFFPIFSGGCNLLSLGMICKIEVVPHG
jgi:hypothetical protein